MADAPTHLYFLGAEGLDFIKVGRSKNPAARLRQLRSGSPYKLRLLRTYDAQGELEPYILTALRARVPTNGEWFLCGDLDFDTLVAQAKERQSQMAPPPTTDGSTATVGLGARIKLARIDKGWKQQDLQAATGLSQKYLSQIELDKVDPRFSIVKRIARALGVSMDRLAVEDEAHV
jgi:DNA-binding XRE family transcriptional regulator